MWHTLKIEEVKRKLKTNFDRGLTNEEARGRQEKIRNKRDCRK